MSSSKCPKCGEKIKKDWKGCPNCGYIKETKNEALVCSNCKAEIEEDWIRCPMCTKFFEIKCPKCDYDLESNWRACPKCGELIKK
ncbi:MAG: Double zinc ribbon [Firmicutes bacterium ADurb.Bin080]|nr:MAG: Double zinc ribbon [Firmicutes bacterium ADurb.Bin080]